MVVQNDCMPIATPPNGLLLLHQCRSAHRRDIRSRTTIEEHPNGLHVLPMHRPMHPKDIHSPSPIAAGGGRGFPMWRVLCRALSLWALSCQPVWVRTSACGSTID